MIGAPLTEIGQGLAMLRWLDEPPPQPSLHPVATVDDALAWIAGTAEVYEYVAFTYDLLSYAYGARALWAAHRRMFSHSRTPGVRATDYLTVAVRQLQLRAAICRRFDEYDVARGLTLAATDLAGVVARLERR